jgi:hypothetical protein
MKPVKNWIEEYFGIKITNETVFLKDLGIAGLDIDPFFTDFITYFEIDASDLNVEEYTLEHTSIWQVWFKGKRIKTFNLKKLETIVENKKWVM